MVPTSQIQREREVKKKKKIVVYQYVFTFHFPPPFLPFDLFYINFCALLLGRSQLKREDLQEWPLGSRTTSSSSINNGLARPGPRDVQKSPLSGLWLWSSFFLSLSLTPLSISHPIISFHSFKTQHETIIQHSSTVGASLFGFAATSESRKRWWRFGESLMATGELGRAWESSRLGESVTTIVVIEREKEKKRKKHIKN